MLIFLFFSGDEMYIVANNDVVPPITKILTNHYEIGQQISSC